MLCLNPAWVRAQERALTITAASAPVHKSPSAGSPVIGKAARGEAVEVTRDVGDWVKVAWPSDPSGVGYVRASLGTRGRPAAAVAGSGVNRPVPQRAGDVSRRPVAGQIEPPANAVAVDPAVPTARQRSTATTYVARPSHVVGIGARMSGPSFGLGGSARLWSPGLLGAQFVVTHTSIETPLDPSRMTSTQFAPSVLFRPTDMMSDSVWVRPYVGTGISMFRSTLTTPTIGIATSDSQLGFQVFGGAEFTVASVPSLGVSLDLGYHSFDSPFVGFDAGGTSIGVSGHWYVK
jgi:hypothetical protein